MRSALRTPFVAMLVLSIALLSADRAAAQKTNKKKKRNQRNRAAALAGSKAEIYKKVGDVELKVHLFVPKNHKPGDKRPAVVVFFGGGWRGGSPTQFGRHCQYLASRGMVAMAADYRVESRHKAKAVQCIADAKSAIRWVRTNANRLGVDPNRIASGGGSAGGHLAAAVGTLAGFDEAGEDLSVSSRPNAMLLFNPALNLTPEGFKSKPDSERMKQLLKRFGTEPGKISPTLHISKTTPPAIIVHGKADTTVPFAQAEEFAAVMKKRGVVCEVAGFAGEKHGFFNFGRGGNKAFLATVKRVEQFLISQKFLTGRGNVEEFFENSRKP